MFLVASWSLSQQMFGLAFLRIYIDHILGTPQFLELPEERLLALLADNDLETDEISIFEAGPFCLSYANR